MGLLEKFLTKPVFAPIKLPDNGGSFLPPQNLENTIVEISLIKNIKGKNPNSDYNIAEKVLDYCKNTGIKIEQIMPASLEKIGYKIEKFTFNTTFQNFRDLEGGVLIDKDQAVSFQKMEEWEVIKASNQIENRANAGDKELIRLSDELRGFQWDIVSSEKIPNKGLKAVIIARGKLEEIPSLNTSPYLTVPVNWKN